MLAETGNAYNDLERELRTLAFLSPAKLEKKV